MNLRVIVVGLVGLAALFVATGSFGASAPPPTGGPTVTIQAAPGNGIIPFAPVTLTMAQLAALPQTSTTIDGGATTESGPTVLSLLNPVAGFTPIGACKNDSLRYWIEASSLTGSAATVTDGEIDPNFGQNTTVLSIKQNGVALTTPRLAVSKDVTEVRDIPAVYNITIGRAPTVFASTTGACNPPTFTALPKPDLGSVTVSGDVSSPSTWTFDQLGPAKAGPPPVGGIFTQVTQSDKINANTKSESGPALYDVVSANSPNFPSGPNGRARGYVQATASDDGTAALVSWAEVDPSLSGSPVTPTCVQCRLLSLTEGGTSVIPGDNGPRLTTPGDNKAGRYIFSTQFVTYLNAPDIALPATGSGPNLAGANAKETPLVNAYLVGANLEGANLNKNNLSGAFLTSADLTGANLNKANLTNAILTGANLSGANLNGVTWSNTTCPDGTNSDADGGSCAGHI